MTGQVFAVGFYENVSGFILFMRIGGVAGCGFLREIVYANVFA
jgi:hypothetical protein